jgi:hypothetical protein
VTKRVLAIAAVTLALGLGCGPRTAREAAQTAEQSTELVDDGGASPFQARLSFMSPEALAIQEVPYREDKLAWEELQKALHRYRNQWTMRLSIGPKPTVKPDPQRPLALDIENNGGQWGDHGRNLQRLMFEMVPFIRLVLPDGKEIEPSLVEFQRSFGMGKDRSFLLVFTKISDGKTLKPPFRVQVREFGQGTGTMVFEVKQVPTEAETWQVKRMWKADRSG